MTIKGKPCIVYDIEVLRNVFTCTCKNTETDIIYIFEISERKNDILDMCEFFFTCNAYFVGYNNHHYDDTIMNYILTWVNKVHVPYFEWNRSIYSFSNKLISTKDDELMNNEEIKKYKFAKLFLSIDLLTMLYSKALRVKLKEMQVTMKYKNVQEFIVDWSQNLPKEEIDKLISYNINDVESTTELLYRSKEKLDLRIEIENEYNINCLSLDGVNLGMKILAKKYMQETGISWYKLKDLRSPCPYIDLEKVILPWIKFKNPILQNVLKDMKNQHSVIPGRKGYINTFLLDNIKITVGVGGIHGDCGTCIIKPKSDELLIDEDVTSLYPSLIIEHNFYPPHLGKEFVKVYANIRKERIEAKRNKDTLKNETLKLALNGLSGNLQQEHSWCYSPFTVMQIRINGQLLLLMLTERLLEIGCKIKQINTDGILFIVKKEKEEEYKRICREWEKETKLSLESEYFESFYQLAVNDYFGKYTNGKIKTKGFFLQEIIPGKGLTPKIISEAVINYFINNVPVNTTVYNCIDIYKFLQSEKTGNQWTIEYNNKEQQHVNRWYVSNNGCYLWKYKTDEEGKKQYQIMLKDYGVTLHNLLYSEDELNELYLNGKTFKDIYDINYAYYTSQAEKIIQQLQPRQLSLW